MDASPIDQFCEAYTKVAGKPHRAADLAEAAGIVVAILREKSAEQVALANLPEAWLAAIAGACAEVGIEVLQPPFTGEKLPARIDQAAVGVTGMAFAIAQTGTLVEATDDDAARLVSSLSRTHVGIVAASTMVAEYRAAAVPIRQILTERNGACTVSFISGPSRTGDIELKLTLGVHGPEEAHAIVMEDA